MNFKKYKRNSNYDGVLIFEYCDIILIMIVMWFIVLFN